MIVGARRSSPSTANDLAPRPAGIGFILSHHRPERYPRTLCVPGTSCSVRLCARCFGAALGLLLFAGLWFLASSQGFPSLAPRVQVFAALAPLWAAGDWTRQSLGNYESRNSVRVASGTLLGLAYADAAALLLTAHWLYAAIAAGVLGVYVLAIVLVLHRKGRLEQVVAEHLPGLRA
ncbi:MAG: DUF2085 domain-containing protein [Euryarchaeota archaeon]|nr:DUF2085 domain-containing protein [Euryarchaeota archaeon]MDE1836248.1 DUF2085 domain-containing protein [Euryarchaeota archaeon]MDE1881630.1 DUF2085 domain-containing protein [Euryarchaeota archaeon]MDE2044991.1 DUF2085 domain-containing protein [Thermoplasmata archaeon]